MKKVLPRRQYQKRSGLERWNNDFYFFKWKISTFCQAKVDELNLSLYIRKCSIKKQKLIFLVFMDNSILVLYLSKVIKLERVKNWCLQNALKIIQ